mmetsp:Transcript_33786/g.66460  ORF Transcript_33786/g.66460 Transcript_33786/m.66460 type:complete len:695 (+) Transcript_33786:1-2085(+)
MSLKHKTPAEFFAEHQNIAGFDNPGKSLYTTIREFVENSLDAAEAVGTLPIVELTVEKLSTENFNGLRGIISRKRKDTQLYESHSPDSKKKKKLRKEKEDGRSAAAAITAVGISVDPEAKEKEPERKERGSSKSEAFFKVTCRDNGGGMPHDQIPKMLGIVLSSTKYGIKQTRGKFGLGAKMALVWSKKSTGLPIEVWSATGTSKLSYCKLDLDIHKNQPRVLEHKVLPNTEGRVGTEISVVISGNWSTYQSKIVNYLRQLAIITPYAHFELDYKDNGSNSKGNKSFSLVYTRRSDSMPAAPVETTHHPSSVDNLLLENLIYHTRQKTLKSFLCKELSCISASLAQRLVDELGGEFESGMNPADLSKKEVHQLATLLREAKFPKPTGQFLAPAGEYNLRLGIIKELEPTFVATACSPPQVYEGHSFVVEGAVSIGGAKAKPGITIFRYANRIPLLFEAGSDVVSQVANKKIKWSSYKIKNTDKIGVFVSLVSTKIPFKGTSKEYIGDDNGVLHNAVKQCIAGCCVQLKKRIQHRLDVKNNQERKKTMTKYVPDVSRAFITMLTTLGDENQGGSAYGPHAKDSSQAVGLTKAQRERFSEIIKDVKTKKLTEQVLSEKLSRHIDRIDASLSLESVTASDFKRGITDSLFISPLKDDVLEFIREALADTSKSSALNPANSSTPPPIFHPDFVLQLLV